jgi:RNA polymerase primary sigma factor
MGRPRKNPEATETPKKVRKPRVKKLKDLYLDEASSPKEAENRRNQLKALIILGKERGYLTHAEINDHLPDEISETDQVDEIVSIIHDMGIRTYDEAPDAESLLMDDAPAPVTDEEAAEEAEQALATVDSEFGRTTDPVRMYMREMGKVGLLDKKEEIEIAKRIEDGLKHMVQAISACPGIIDDLMQMGDKVKNGELSVDEFVDGLIDIEAEKELNEALGMNEDDSSSDDSADSEDDDESSSDNGKGMSSEDLKILTDEVLKRFKKINTAHKKLSLLREKNKWIDDPEYKKHQDLIQEELLNFRFSAKLVEVLCEKVRQFIVQIRSHERAIMDFCVSQAKMPRTQFIKPILPSWIKSKNCKPRLVYFLAIDITNLKLASIISRLALLARDSPRVI